MFNGEPFIEECVCSVLGQTFQDFDIIAVDDGSTDKSCEVLSGFADRRVKVFREEKNQGAAAARNRAVGSSDSEFLAFLDSDDLAYPSRLAKQIDALRRSAAIDLVASEISLLHRTGSRSRQHESVADSDIPPVLLFRNCIIQSTVLLRRSAWVPYRPEFILAEDYDLWCRMSIEHHFKILREPLVVYRDHSGQISERRKGEMIRSVTTIHRWMLEPFGAYSPIHHRLANWPFDATIDELKHAEIWLIQLLQANRRYAPAIFERVLKKVWYSICLDSWEIGPEVLKIYSASNLAGASIGNRFRLLRRFGSQIFRKRS